MKRIIMIIGIAFTAIQSNSLTITPKMNDFGIHTVKPEKHIDLYLTSKSGCKFHIVGEAGAFPPSFTGSITISGPPPCPKGTWDVAVKNPVGTHDLIYESGDTEGYQLLIENDDIAEALMEAIQ